MTKIPRPYNLEEILAGYVLGDLDEAELAWFQKQLEANPQLLTQVKELELTLNLLPYSLPPNQPTPELRNRILAQPKASKIPYSWIISTVTAIVSLLLGFNNLNLRHQIARTESHLQHQQELLALMRQPSSHLVKLTASDRTVGTSGSLFIAPESKMAVLALNNLATLPEGHVYRLWAVSQEKKTGCSNFQPNARGEVYLNLSGDDALFDASGISITIEPQPNTENPVGQEFLFGSYSSI